MCSPQVMAKVRDEMTRRRFLGRVGAVGAGAALGAVGVGSAAARQGATPVAGGGSATPGAGPLASPVAVGVLSRVQDLTHVASPAFPVFPAYNPMRITPLFTVEGDGFYVNELTLVEHTGTHMDAPGHFDADGITAELIPVERLVAPLAVVDISARAAGDPDAQLTPDDLLAWEGQHGALPAGAFVAMYSGWAARLIDPASFLNADTAGVLHFPGIHPEAAALLIEERDVVGVGVDTLSIDFGPSTDFGTHLTVLPAGKYGIENLAGLELVPPSGATIVVGGPKHATASGGPTRALALF